MSRLDIHCSVSEEAYYIIERKRKELNFLLGEYISESVILRERDKEAFFEQKARHHARQLEHFKGQLDVIREKKKSLKKISSADRLKQKSMMAEEIEMEAAILAR